MEIVIDHEITLKQISRNFAAELQNLVKLNFKESLCYWCPDLIKTYSSIESTIAHIDDANKKFQEDGSPDFLIFQNKFLVGLISLSPVNTVNSSAEIGYWLGAEFQGKGIIVRSFSAVLDYAKDTLKLKSVQLSTAVPNLRSQKLPLKFNFMKIKTIPKAEILKDGVVDHFLWSIGL
ncbi:MAG: GNAT family protein [Pseudobdellovibrio sp.]